MSGNRKPSKTIENKTNKEEDSSLKIIEQGLKDINPKVFEGVPITQKKEIIRTIISFKHHSGPLPDPETMAAYNEMIPNGADRIMVIFEEQARHRMGLENIAIPAQVKQSGIGQIIGGVLSTLIIIAAVVLGMYGHETTACVLGGTTIVSLAIIFVLGKVPKSPNKENKK